MEKKPFLAVLEGLDGSGKSTQFARAGGMLAEHFPERGVRCVSFPDYNSPAAEPVKLYLSGAFSSSPTGVNAYAATSFYAVDRYASYKTGWEADYTAGKLIFAARYTTSNAIYQTAKLPHSQWDAYLDWLADYEFGKLGLPAPDLVLLLDMPVAVSMRLLAARYGGDEHKKDLHESDLNFMETCRETAHYAAQKMGWRVISCAEDGEPLPVGEITEKILRLVQTAVTDAQ